MAAATTAAITTAGRAAVASDSNATRTGGAGAALKCDATEGTTAEIAGTTEGTTVATAGTTGATAAATNSKAATAE